MADLAVREIAELQEVDIGNLTGIANTEEERFFSAVQAGDASIVAQYLSSEQANVNVNCINEAGKSALQVAVENDHKEIVALLLQSKATDWNHGALLQAVSRCSLPIAKMLLSSGRMRPADARSSATLRITPLILAVQLGDYNMTKLLIQHGHTIPAPADAGTEYESNPGDQAGALLFQRLFRFCYYQALANPMYICLCYELLPNADDPIARAFYLNRKLHACADCEYESRLKYLELADQCEDLAVSLLDACQNIEEVAAVMGLEDWQRLNRLDHESRLNNLRMLNIAVENGHEKFAAHSNTQEILNNVIYQGAPEWRYKKWSTKCLLACCYTLLLPVSIVVYFFWPNSRMSQAFRSPAMKFLHQTSMLVLFLVCLVASSLQDEYEFGTKISSIDLAIMVWVIGMTFQEVRESISYSVRRYLREWWNLITLAMLFLFLLAYALWIIAYAIQTEYLTICDVMGDLDGRASVAFLFTLIGNSAFSVASVLAFFHTCSAFQVNSWLGPLQLSLYKMLLDIFKFLCFFFLLYVSFAVGLRRLYSFYEDFRLRTNLHSRDGVCNTTDGISKHVFSGTSGTLSNLFWAIFGLIDLSTFEIAESRFKTTEYTAKFLFGLFLICVVLVSLNMLIAMMSNTFNKVENESDAAWKYSRTAMWLGFVQKGNCVPAPFNLIPNPHFIRKMCSRMCSSSEQLSEDVVGGNSRQSFQNNQDRKQTVITRLVHRYFQKTKDKTKDLAEQIEKLKQEVFELHSRLAEFTGSGDSAAKAIA